MAARAPIGGVDTVVLGGDDSKAIFNQRQQERTAVVETPSAAQRFQQAPGGVASITLGNSNADESANVVAMRGPVGGNDTVVLGGADSKEVFNERKEQRERVLATPDAAPRFKQVPNASSVSIRGDEPVAELAQRGPVGGADTVVFGQDDSKAIFDHRQQQREALLSTPQAAPRFAQVPNASSVPLSGACAGAAADGVGVEVRGPVGGIDNVLLGGDDAKAVFNERKERCERVPETPDAAPRFAQVPNTSSIALGASAEAGDAVVTVRGPVGGSTSICLGQDGCDAPLDESGATRGPVGGADTIVLGGDDSKAIFSEHKEQREKVLATPDAALRFSQVPNASSVSIRDDAPAADIAQRGPVGGADTLVFGHADSKAIFEQRREQREMVIDTPDAALRFAQVPNYSTVSLSNEIPPLPCCAEATRGPVGGADTVVLGGDDSAEIFKQRREARQAVIDTPDAAHRFSQVPNASSVALGGAGDCSAAVATRGPVGGAASVVLGGDDTKELFERRREEREAVLETPDASQRFHQVPNASSITAGSTGVCSATAEDAVAMRGPVGGAATIVFGAADSKEIFDQRREQREAVPQTPEPAQRFQQVPNASTVSLAACSEPLPSPASTRGPVGGETTIVLGGDGPGETFASHGPIETPDAAPRFQQAPGGTTTIVLGDDGESAEGADHAPKGIKTKIGKTIAHIPSTRQHQPPGGSSSIVFGIEGPVHKVSSNQFANGSNQNCGNAITERPSTRLHHAPGGASSICLGGEGASDVPVKVSSNQFANGASQNCGNAITDKPSTRLHHAPGGASSICLGASDEPNKVSVLAEKQDENVDTTNVPHDDAMKAKPAKAQVTPGGAATIVLG